LGQEELDELLLIQSISTELEEDTWLQNNNEEIICDTPEISLNALLGEPSGIF